MADPDDFPIQHITKLDAARRQLRTAVELFFASGDEVPIHTLAAAARQVIADLLASYDEVAAAGCRSI